MLSQTRDNARQARLTSGGCWMAVSNSGRVSGLIDEQIVYAALAAIDQALEQALTARSEREQQWRLTQLRGLLLILPASGLSLEDNLRRLIRLVGTPLIDR
jgi:hypothetical protein